MYEDTHGFGFEDDYDERDYKAFTETEGFKALWSAHCKALDEWRDCMNRFCESMERFTDGQISKDTAKKMATNPRLAKNLEAIMMGGIA